MSEHRRMILSGIRPTAEDQHLGNYLGAMKNFVVDSQNPANECYFFVADQHALTTAGKEFDPLGIQRGTRAIVLNLLAAGVSEESCFYAQSAVPETSELAWILNCLAYVHDLEDMHHWAEKKGKLAQLGAEANSGLLTYPVLMAADILGPLADEVPVGHDQRQHVEFARDLARRFNAVTKSKLFIEPAIALHDDVTVRSLGKPETGAQFAGKMGKSDPKGCINLNDPPDVIRAKVRKAYSDPARTTRDTPGTPEICNVYTLHQLLSDGEVIARVQRECRTAGITCFDCKSLVAETIIQLLAPIQERRRELDARGPGYVEEILATGNARARARIAPVVAQAKDFMGLMPAAEVRRG